MISFQYVIKRCKYELKKPMLYICIIAVLIIVYDALGNVIKYANLSGEAFTPWIFSHITSDRYLLLCILLTFLLLISNAPNDIKCSETLSKSTNISDSIMSEILFLMLKCTSFVVLIWVTIFMFGLGHLSFSTSWGAMFRRLSQPNPYTGIICEEVILSYSAIQASVYSSVLLWLVCLFLSLVGVWTNLMLKGMSPFVMGVLGLFDFYLYLYVDDIDLIYWFSPTSWSNLSTILSIEGMSVKICIGILVAIDSLLMLIVKCTAYFYTEKQCLCA